MARSLRSLPLSRPTASIWGVPPQTPPTWPPLCMANDFPATLILMWSVPLRSLPGSNDSSATVCFFQSFNACRGLRPRSGAFPPRPPPACRAYYNISMWSVSLRSLPNNITHLFLKCNSFFLSLRWFIHKCVRVSVVEVSDIWPAGEHS